MDRGSPFRRERLIVDIPQQQTLLADSREMIDRVINKFPRRG